MAYGAVEIAALIIVIISAIKLLIVVFNPKTWLKVIKFLYSSPVILFIVELVLAAVLFYYLIQDFTIVQIMAIIALGALLTGMSFAVYAKETIAWAGKFLNSKTLLTRAWLPILIWLALIIWAVIELFG